MHAHIQIRQHGDVTFTLDDQDITKHVLADGFAISYDPDTRGAIVDLRLKPKSFTVEGDVADVPESVQLILAGAVDKGDV